MHSFFLYLQKLEGCVLGVSDERLRTEDTQSSLDTHVSGGPTLGNLLCHLATVSRHCRVQDEVVVDLVPPRYTTGPLHRVLEVERRTGGGAPVGTGCPRFWGV